MKLSSSAILLVVLQLPTTLVTGFNNMMILRPPATNIVVPSTTTMTSSLKSSSLLSSSRTSFFGKQRSSSSSSFLYASMNNNVDDDNDDDNNNKISLFNPLNFKDDEWMKLNSHDSKSDFTTQMIHSSSSSNNNNNDNNNLPLFTTTSVIAIMTTFSTQVSTAAAAAASNPILSSGEFNPDNFRPVCPASDSIYRIAQSSTQSLVGSDNFVEYGPLIAGGLLRVRLELCVVESFFNEAVGPFIAKEGLGWILPLHETVETFLAGTIFALASTFILVGSTKIVSVLVTYVDVFVGGPMRFFGGFAFDRAKGKPVTLDVGFGPFKTRVIGPGNPKDDKNKKEETLEEILDFSQVKGKDLPIALVSGAVKGVGETSKVVREVLEALDLFVGRYLTLIATGYIGLKFIHFKVFPDFP